MLDIKITRNQNPAKKPEAGQPLGFGKIFTDLQQYCPAVFGIVCPQNRSFTHQSLDHFPGGSRSDPQAFRQNFQLDSAGKIPGDGV